MSYGVDRMSEEKAYWTHEVADILEVSDSTLRKWCLALEKHGYTFTKGKNNSRAFLVRDRDILMNLKHLMRTTGISLEKASYQVLNELKVIDVNESNDTHSGVPEVVRESFENELKKIHQRLDKQEEFQERLMQRLDERDNNLMTTLREIQETKKQIAAADKKWWKFWK